MKKLFLTTGLMFAFVGNVYAVTVTPKITKISVTPTSATAGTMFKFTATLNAPLTAGNKVKIDLGKGLASMTGTNTSYSLSRAIYTTGKQNYKIKIVNARNVVQGTASSGSYTVTSAEPKNNAPTLTLTSADATATANKKYLVTLNAKDVDANLSSITMNWGDSTAPETLTATDSKDLVFSHTYATASSFGWNAFATDKGSPALTSKLVSKIVTVSNPVPVEIIEPPIKTSGYTKIANNGLRLPDSATLGTNPTDWACTKDNKTGLVWEVKTTDGGLRNMNYYYANYDEIYPKCDDALWGVAGYCNNGLGKLGDSTNTDGFVKATNKQSLCGAQDWRLPSWGELMQLVSCSDGKYNQLDEATLNSQGYGFVCKSNAPPTINTTSPTIDTTYFPNTMYDGFSYWSSSPYANDSDSAWYVSFGNGFSSNTYKFNGGHVRLVR